MTADGIGCKISRNSFTCRIVFDFILKQSKPDVVEDTMVVRGRQIPLAVIRNHRARRYLLRLRPDGSVRLTIPRRGSVLEGRRFAERNAEWLGRQLERLSAHPVKPKQWTVGTEILFRGEQVKLEAGVNGESSMIRFGGEAVKVKDHGTDIAGKSRVCVANHCAHGGKIQAEQSCSYWCQRGSEIDRDTIFDLETGENSENPCNSIQKKWKQTTSTRASIPAIQIFLPTSQKTLDVLKFFLQSFPSP